MCDTYNGWVNRETWATALYLDNDEGMQSEVIAIAKVSKDKYECGTLIKEFLEEILDMENMLDAPVGVRKNLIVMSTDIGSIYRVDWAAIGESYMVDSKVN